MSGQPCAVAAQPGSEPVTLPQILEFADANAPVLRAARSTRARADASDVAAAPRMPSNPELTVYVGPRFGEVGTGVDVQVSLMQEIQIGGERGLRVEASQHFRTQTEAEIDQVRWFVHADVHAAFHRALVERERARLAERVVAFQTDILRVVERQIAAGSEAPLALRLAQAEVAQAQQQLVAAQQAYAASCIRLAQLSGWPVTTPPEPVGHAESPTEPPPLAQLQARARERVPSVVAGRARVRTAVARVAVADREAWPRPTVGVQYNREGSPTRAGAFDIIMGVVSVPIPSFQTNQGARAMARAEVVVAEAELQATLDLLDGQIAEAHSATTAAALRALAYGTEILPRFEDNLTFFGARSSWVRSTFCRCRPGASVSSASRATLSRPSSTTSSCRRGSSGSLVWSSGTTNNTMGPRHEPNQVVDHSQCAVGSRLLRDSGRRARTPRGRGPR
ncbi:MAG: TolC family protein [Sandaracinaceae bacterium]|nr:TolC family protein [Sandaracinaceae bacterium]